MSDEPTTRATTWLRDEGADFSVVTTEPARSAEESAERQGIELSRLLKTIVVRKTDEEHLFVLVPGDREIDWKKLRAHVGVSRLSLPDRSTAEAVTGYKPGTITPFGAATRLPVILDASVDGADPVALGGGEHGVNVHLSVAELKRLTGAEVADVTNLR